VLSTAFCCCSYGFISNLNYGTALGVAWLAFVKKYGVAPTAPGQWKVFLAFYAGARTAACMRLLPASTE
jgi:hypothetical protein